MPLKFYGGSIRDGPQIVVVSGASTGEGIIWHVRDAIRERSAIREKGRIVGYGEIESDLGVSDKRLLVREAFDSGHRNILTEKQAARASGAHISFAVFAVDVTQRRVAQAV